MQKKAKKGIVALCCMMLMAASVLSVSAAARHVCVKEEVVLGVGEPYSWKSEDKHWATQIIETRCSDPKCTNTFGQRRENVEQSHSWYHADDLGHGARYDHKYRLTCGNCGGQKVVTIICDYINSGRHDTP